MIRKYIYQFFVFIGFISIGTSDSLSQDMHFSQYHKSPMNLNPAMTGDFDGDYRIIGNERRQWTRISTPIPYQTFGVSVDAHDFLNQQGMGAGIAAYRDVDGDSKFSTTKINLSGSYRFTPGSDSTVSLVGALQLGFTQRSIDYSDLYFDRQFNGYYYDATLSTDENFQITSRSYPNLNTGILWRKDLSHRKYFMSGIGIYNLTIPNQSFFNNEDIRLNPRFNLHAKASFVVYENWDLVPQFLLSKQGKLIEFVPGVAAKYIIDDNRYHYRTIWAGMWTRAADAGFVSLGMDFNDLHVGVSYDLNYSRLKPASNGRGGLEIAIIYIIRNNKPKVVPHKICPDFI